MLKTNLAISLLNENKKLSFDKIWSKIGKDIMLELKDTKQQEIEIKNDYYLSMLQDENLIMIGNNTWALRQNYSAKEINNINEQLLGDELLKVETPNQEEEDVTKEILADEFEEE